MTLNAIIELSKICEKQGVKMGIDETGIVLSTLRHGKEIKKHYDIKSMNIITLDFPLQIIIDMFLEEHVLKFKRAIC